MSPITPSEPAPQKFWVQDPNSSQGQVIQAYTVPHSGESVVVKPYGVSASESGFVPVQSLVSLPHGFVADMLSKSESVQKQANVRSQISSRQTTSPKARHSVQSVQAKSHDHQRLVSHFPSSSAALGTATVSNEAVKVFPSSRDPSTYSVPSHNIISTTQPGPPNITISSSSAIFTEGKPIKSQKYQRNPFTFPATPPASLTIERPLVGGVLSFNQSKQPESEVKIEDKNRHPSGEMPQLLPVSPVKRDKKTEVKSEPTNEELVPIVSAALHLPFYRTIPC